MTQPLTPGAPPPPASTSTSGPALWSLILGIVSIVCCSLVGPIAWYIGSKEVKAVDAGMSPANNRGFAFAGMILGIVGTVLLALAVVWMVFFGGMTVLSALSQGAGS